MIFFFNIVKNVISLCKSCIKFRYPNWVKRKGILFENCDSHYCSSLNFWFPPFWNHSGLTLKKKKKKTSFHVVEQGYVSNSVPWVINCFQPKMYNKVHNAEVRQEFPFLFAMFRTKVQDSGSSGRLVPESAWWIHGSWTLSWCIKEW